MPPVVLRLAPGTALKTTEHSFKLLIIPIGFSTTQDRLAAANDAWARIKIVPPFNLVDKLNQAARDAISVYYWRDEPPTLDLQQNGIRLSIPLARATAIADALATVQIGDAADDGAKAASVVWPRNGLFGRIGGLVAIVNKSNTPGELYELAPSENYPVPVIGACVAGDEWHRVLVRGLAQTYGGLVDEFERPEPEFLRIDGRSSGPALEQRRVLRSGHARQVRG